MTDDTPTRRSTRARQPNKKYNVDPLEGLDFRASSDSGSSSSEDQEEAESAEDENFAIHNSGEDDVDEDELASSGADDDIDLRRQAHDYSGEALLDDNESIVGSDEDLAAPTKETGGKRNARQAKPSGRPLGLKKHTSNPATQQTLPAFAIGAKQIPTNIRHRTRAIHDLHAHAAKDAKIIYSFGPADEDLAPIILARDKWIDQATLPSHKHDRKGAGGFDYSFYYTEEIRQTEVNRGWKWFDECGGKEAFEERQTELVLSTADGNHYRPPKRTHRLVLGPYPKQQLFNLQVRETVELKDAFPIPSGSTRKARNGVVMNVGGTPEHVQWVPNNPGEIQYLIVVTTNDSDRAQPNEAISAAGTSQAFTPSQASSSAIQVWAVHTSSKSDANKHSPRHTPRLEAVFCFNWGPIKELKFCPMMRALTNDSKVRLGFIAGIWGDGYIRVLDLSYPKPMDHSAQPDYIKISSAAFASRPPATVCTTVTWLSSSAVAAGCANGCVAVWDLPSAIKTNLDPDSSGPRAWFYQTLHPTYILRVVSCWPSRPHMLVTASMDGYHRLTDLRSPEFDFIFSNRTRVGQDSAVWHDQTQSIIFVDDNYAFRSLPLRRFFASIFHARAHAPATVMASSLLHPFVLGGCTDGDVVIYNPIRRVLYSKADVFLQTWFRHEWRRVVTQQGLNMRSAPN